MHQSHWKKRKWTLEQLKNAAKTARSVRQVIKTIGLIPAGGNYFQIRKYLKQYKIDTTHFKGRGWNKGLRIPKEPVIPLVAILTKGSTFQSYKLKRRLLAAGLKSPKCEDCGWAKRAPDGRLPLELDHINGDSNDNRLDNLRVLCPNCHSLQPTHRGKNKKRR